MAFVHGKETTLTLDGTAFAAYTDNAALNRTMDPADTTTFGNDDRTYIAGLRDASFTASGSWDATADNALHGAQDLASIAWNYSPDGGTTTYSGNGFVTNYSPASPVGDKNTWSVIIQVTGAVSRA